MAALTYTTAIVFIPPEECWPAIQAIREQHDRKYRRWMPHITLVYPFCPVDDFPTLHEPLAAAVARLPPFDVTLAEFKTFRHRRDSTIWLAPEPLEPLVELHEVLWKASLGWPGSSGESRFQPHLSVGQVQGKDKMKRLLEELQAAWKSLSFRVDRVSIIWRREPPDDAFRIAEEIPLAGDLLENRTSP